MADDEKVIKVISQETDARKVERIYENALRLNNLKVAEIALRRLGQLGKSNEKSAIENEVWRAISTLERLLKDERGVTVRLSRTRQKIQRVGEKQTVADLALKPSPSDGFLMLVDRSLPELTFEAIVIRNAPEFDDTVVHAAKGRLKSYGIELSRVNEVSDI